MAKFKLPIDLKKTGMSTAKALIPFAGGAAVGYVSETIVSRNTFGLGKLGESSPTARAAVTTLVGAGLIALASALVKNRAARAKVATAMGIGLASVVWGPQLAKVSQKAADTVSGLLPANTPTQSTQSATVLQMPGAPAVAGAPVRYRAFGDI